MRLRACRRGSRGSAPNFGEVLGGLKYPLYFADFETVNPAIPRFAGMRPYDQLAFSVVGACAAANRARSQSTTSFLPQMRAIPGASSSRSLCAALGESGSIVVYSSFESQRLSDLASWLPEFADRINAIQARLFDLLPVVREHIYHPAFAGSYSIKSVLARARAGDDLRRHGGRERAGRRAGLGVAGARRAWIATSATGSGRLCWTTAGRTRWRWSGCWRSFGLWLCSLGSVTSKRPRVTSSC